MNPYKNQPDYKFWKRSVVMPPLGQVDPVTNTVRIDRNDPIATMGSCFAQHIANRLVQAGFNYLVTESDPLNRTATQPFSARFGNVYTVRQALQLFSRAFDHTPHYDGAIWKVDEGYLDAFRPTVNSNPFSSIDDLMMSREIHLRSVKEMFSTAKWLIFTLGLTESWVSTKDGFVIPLAPGVISGDYEHQDYKFYNFSLEEVENDLEELISKLNIINPKCGVILTVSPVPLIATYENRHVLQSNTISKSILRLACHHAERRFTHVVYFPSFEIITNPASQSQFFEDDFRSVTTQGVDQVMRTFFARYTEPGSIEYGVSGTIGSSTFRATNGTEIDVLCDEDIIEDALRIVEGTKRSAYPDEDVKT